MMKRILASVALISVLIFPRSAQCDLFGGDVAVLTQILVNAVQQLAQLRSILESAKGNLDLMNEVYRGIHDAIQIIRTINPNADPGLYKDWKKVEEAIQKIEEVYGKIPMYSDSQIQKDADQSVAEAISFNNELYDYTRELDEIGEQIKTYSRSTSPAGATKLTAESLGVLVTVLNQSLRAQAKGLKLQAVALEAQNSKDKKEIAHRIEGVNAVTTAMKTDKAEFKIPRL
jgi:hypothetical protein